MPWLFSGALPLTDSLRSCLVLLLRNLQMLNWLVLHASGGTVVVTNYSSSFCICAGTVRRPWVVRQNWKVVIYVVGRVVNAISFQFCAVHVADGLVFLYIVTGDNRSLFGWGSTTNLLSDSSCMTAPTIVVRCSFCWFWLGACTSH